MTEVAAITVLGETCLVAGGAAVPIGGPLPRGLLALLSIDAPRSVSLDRITDLLWGDDAPRDVKGAVQQTATRVRRALGRAGCGDALQSVGTGYRLALTGAQVDAQRFRTLVAEAVSLAAVAGRSGDAVARLDEALSLWAGPAFDDLSMLPLTMVLGPALDEERWQAEDLRARCLVALGRAEEADHHLSDALAREPTREHLWVRRVQALASLGRPGDAARAAAMAASVLRERLGVGPGPELRRAIAELADVTEVPRRAERAPAPPRPLVDRALVLALETAAQDAATAMARGDHHAAVRQAERALALADRVAPDDGPLRLRLLLLLGDCHNVASTDAQAREAFRAAADLARRLDDHRGLARAALGYAADRIGFQPPPEQGALLQEAIEALGEEDLVLRSRLLARYAGEHYWTTSPARTVDLAAEALATAVRSGDDLARLQARYAGCFGSWTPAGIPQLLSAAEAYLVDAKGVGDPQHEVMANRWLALAATELGGVAHGGRAIARAVAIADDVDLGVQRWFARVIQSAHLIVAGDLVAAERVATDAFAIGALHEPDHAMDYLGLLVWTCRWVQGRLHEVEAMVEEVGTSPGVDTARRLGLAMTRADLGRPDDALAVLDSVTEDEVLGLPPDASWTMAMAAMAEAAAATGHARTAALAAELLAPFEDRIAVTAATATGPVAHQLGLAVLTAGRTREGLELLRHAVDVADRSGTPAFGARSRIELASRLAASHPGDALALAAASLRVAEELGLDGVHRRAERLLH